MNSWIVACSAVVRAESPADPFSRQVSSATRRSIMGRFSDKANRLRCPCEPIAGLCAPLPQKYITPAYMLFFISRSVSITFRGSFCPVALLPVSFTLVSKALT